jgi:hypothetical protein
MHLLRSLESARWYSVGDRKIAVPQKPEEGRVAGTHTKLPVDRAGRLAPGPDMPGVNASQMMSDTDGHPIVPRVVAAP